MPKNDVPLFHVVGKSLGDQWPAPSLKLSWKIFSQALDDISDEGVRTHAFVMMKNHYHWICRYDFRKDPAILEWFHERVAIGFLQTMTDHCRVFEGEPSLFEIKHIKQYQSIYRYVYQNPVKAGIVARAQDYPFSSIGLVLGKTKKTFICTDEMNLIYYPGKVLNWVNRF